MLGPGWLVASPLLLPPPPLLPPPLLLPPPPPLLLELELLLESLDDLRAFGIVVRVSWRTGIVPRWKRCVKKLWSYPATVVQRGEYTRCSGE